MASLDSFKCQKTLKVGAKTYVYYSLPTAEKNGLKGISRLPYSMKVLLENMLRNEDDNGQDRRNDLYMKVISLSERSKTMKTLADSLRVVVDMERTAFGMDKEQEKAADPLTSLLKTITGGTDSAFKPVAQDPDHDED